MNYNNPPIVEAIFDVRVSGTRYIEDKIEKLGSLFSSKDSIFCNRHEQNRLDFTVKGNNPSEMNHNHRVDGYVFINEDKSRRVQTTYNGFTFNMLAPYTSWGDFVSQSFKYWEKYKEAIGEYSIDRIAVRYINKIRIPTDGFEFERYLTSSPSIPQDLPQTFVAFDSRMVIPDESKTIHAIIRQSFELLPTDEVELIVDVDAFKQEQFSLDLETDFEKLREFKNRIFESLITDSARNTFE